MCTPDSYAPTGVQVHQVMVAVDRIGNPCGSTCCRDERDHITIAETLLWKQYLRPRGDTLSPVKQLRRSQC